MAQDQLWVQMETGRILPQAPPQFLCHEGSRWVPLSRNGGLNCAHRCVCTPGRPALPNGIWIWSTVAQDQLLLQTETQGLVFKYATLY